jgi:hypothetical protein
MVIGLVLIHRRDFFVALWRGWADWIRTLRFRIGGRAADPADRLHALALRTLADAGLAKPAGVPLRAHLREAGGGLPPAMSEALLGACELLYRSRFMPVDPPGAAEFTRAGDAIRASENRDRRRAGR